MVRALQGAVDETQISVVAIRQRNAKAQPVEAAYEWWHGTAPTGLQNEQTLGSDTSTVASSACRGLHRGLECDAVLHVFTTQSGKRTAGTFVCPPPVWPAHSLCVFGHTPHVQLYRVVVLRSSLTFCPWLVREASVSPVGAEGAKALLCNVGRASPAAVASQITEQIGGYDLCVSVRVMFRALSSCASIPQTTRTAPSTTATSQQPQCRLPHSRCKIAGVLGASSVPPTLPPSPRL